MTEKQKRFCDEYLIDCNATRAYREAYPNCKKNSSADAAARTDSTAVHGGGNCREDALLNNISERTELERAKQKTAEWVEWANKALRVLTNTDRHLLNVLFYINRHKG